MPSTFSFLRRWASELDYSTQPPRTPQVPIEPLEFRQFLTAVSPIEQLTTTPQSSVRQPLKDSPPHNNNHNKDNTAFPNMLGIFRGNIFVTNTIGIFPGDVLRASLRIDNQTLSGQVDGTLSIFGFGTSDVTGTITRNKANLSFTGDNRGILTGKTELNGDIFSGKTFAQLGDVNNTEIRGPFRFKKKITFFPTTTSNDRRRGFRLSSNFPTTSGFSTNDLNTFTNLPTGNALDTGFGTRIITFPTTGFVPVSPTLFKPIPSAGSTLATPISAGSILNAPSAAFSTSPVSFGNSAINFHTVTANPVTFI